MAYYPYCFTINRLRLPARLGCHSPERSVSQPVEVSVRLYFASEPAFVSNDDAAFIDYDALCGMLKDLVKQHEFQLIEYMAGTLFRHIRSYLDASAFSDVRVWLSLTKCEAPVELLEGGAGFVLSDMGEGDTHIAPK